MARHGSELTARQRVALVALLEASSVQAAARDTNIPERTLHRWLRTEPFAGEFRAASRARLARCVGALRVTSEEALETLRGLLRDETTPAAVRCRAAAVLLDTAVRVDTDELRVRVEALEASRAPTHP